MDFPSHPNGWVPLPMEEKRVKEQERIEKRIPVSIIYSKTFREKEWEPVHNVLDRYHKDNTDNKLEQYFSTAFKNYNLFQPYDIYRK